MITEQEILNEAERQSDSRLNGHDVSAFVSGAKWMRQKLENLNCVKSENKPLGVVRPPLGLTPKFLRDKQEKMKRLNEVRGAIARYYDADMKINIEWIKEYNELIESVDTH